MLSVRNRQSYLKALGFYIGRVDGIEGDKTKKAYAALQDKYFTRKDDKDGLYGKNTDKLLQNAYRVSLYCENFKLEEFKCQCGGKYCTGYPAILDTQLLINVQSVRKQFGSTVISSGMRCSKHNSKVGGSLLSRHKSGKALDIKGAYTKTESDREHVMRFWKTLPEQRYTYCNINGSNPGMGNSVHVDVK
jgi:hypothetical protein